MRLPSRTQCLWASLVVGIAGLAPAASAQPRVDQGQQEYLWHCATCHGASGTGDGELRRYLTQAPSDLTTLAKRNGGTFPNQLVWELIDGRTDTRVGPHGNREMPVWGQRFRNEALDQAHTRAAPEWYVRNRIVALLDYLSRIQVK